MIRLTSRPAILPASFVAWRWSSLKYAGTVMTALSTVSPRYASASVFSLPRIIALISGGENCLPPASTRASPFGPETTLYGTIDSSVFTSASLRPMKRLIEKTVFCGLVTACRLATVPTRRSPDCVNATTDGVVRPPSAFSITVGSPPSSTAIQLLVVPRSIPIVLAINYAPIRSRSCENLSVSVADLRGPAKAFLAVRRESVMSPDRCERFTASTAPSAIAGLRDRLQDRFDARRFDPRDAPGTDRLLDLVHPCVADVLEAFKPFPQRQVGDIPVAVVCRLREDGQDQFCDRVPVGLRRGYAVDEPQSVPDGTHP